MVKLPLLKSKLKRIRLVRLTLMRLVLLISVLAGLILTALTLMTGATSAWGQSAGGLSPANGPFLVVLGIAQDGGVPQAGTKQHPGWDDPACRRLATCLAIVEPSTSRRWLIDATPDFREQLHRLDTVFPVADKPGLAGIFLTHAHMGHYTGLMHLGFEVMGASRVPVHAMPRMAEYLRTNGPWSQLVRYENIVLSSLQAGQAVRLSAQLTVTPFLVPHRQEYSEVVGFRIDGPRRSVLYIPDIDSWEDWDAQGTRIEDMLAGVDVAYLDGTFFADGEIPGRDMSTFPHPFIRHSMDRFAPLANAERAKIHFLHLNHTNPALVDTSQARQEIYRRGFHVAAELERIDL
jgi:pyrroloquinoline quinone biosynthesis protein B